MSHYTHSDPAVRELIAAAEARGAERYDRLVKGLEARWSDALDTGCPSCGPFIDDCDHIEGYHHALSDLWALLASVRGER